jgi:argininosuccinate lyase
MKKKTVKNKKKNQQKTETVHQSLAVLKQMILNLERVVKELVAQTEQLRYSQSRFKDTEIDTKKYWPNTEPPFKFKDIMWNDNSSSQGEAIDKGLQ